jgi:hypothetical protein
MAACGSTRVAALPRRWVVKNVMDNRDFAKARSLALLAIGVWFVAAATAGALGIVNEPGRPPLVLLSFFVVPILGFVLAYAASSSFRAFTETIPMWVLVGSHLWRFVGIGFVIGWLTGALPGGFGIPEGLGDIVAALGALLLLPGVRRGTASRGWLLAWNTFGMLDLLSAITVGLLYSQSALGVLSTPTSSTVLMVTFPISIIPTFFVPLFLLMHTLTFKRIAEMRESRSVGAIHNAPAREA